MADAKVVRLREKNTGSVVAVPEADADGVLALGYYERVEEKAAPKKASPSSSKSK